MYLLVEESTYIPNSGFHNRVARSTLVEKPVFKYRASGGAVAVHVRAQALSHESGSDKMEMQIIPHLEQRKPKGKTLIVRFHHTWLYTSFTAITTTAPPFAVG